MKSGKSIEFGGRNWSVRYVDVPSFGFDHDLVVGVESLETALNEVEEEIEELRKIIHHFLPDEEIDMDETELVTLLEKECSYLADI